MANNHDTPLPRRKRSARLTLALMGAGAASVLTGCDIPPPPSSQPVEPVHSDVDFSEPKAYRSVDDCVDDGVYTRATCEKGYTSAKEQAPRFTSIQECEEEHGEGNCTTHAGTGQTSDNNGGSWVTPALMGYMVGNMTATRSADNSRVNRIYQEPVYRTRENRGQWGAASSQVRDKVSTRNQAFSSSVAKQNTRYASSQTTSRSKASSSGTQRSGFGSRSSARGGFSS